MPLCHNDPEARNKIVPGALHRLRAVPKTVHWGYFDASLALAASSAGTKYKVANTATHANVDFEPYGTTFGVDSYGLDDV